MTTRVLLADDHRIVREGLLALLAKEGDLEIVGEAADGREAVALARQLQPHVVVMDIAMPSLNGLEATRLIHTEQPGVRVLVLSMHADPRFAAEALHAGATGYLLKDCAHAELAEAVRTVAAGRVYFSASMTGVVVGNLGRQAPGAKSSAFTLLTARERQILQLLAEGKGTKEIGNLLQISAKTVETHRTHIMSKLGLYTIAELTRYAVREGLLSA
jgi:DNA-binding NarL/FixJ family response regulator